jgi:gliding motility-associated-like protein
VLATGIYTVTATNSNGCTGTATTNVTVNALPLPAANSNSPICSGTSLNLTSNGGVDYDWTGPNAYVMNNTQNPSINPASALGTGTYTVTVTDGNNCSATATVSAIVNALPNAVAGNGGPVCDGSNVGLTSGGGTSYAWNGPGGYNDPTQNPIIAGATPAQSGIYTVTVTDLNTCSSTATTTLTVNSLPVVGANTNAPLCDGSNVTVNGNGAVNYAWTGPNGFNVVGQSPVINNITALDNGIYTVTGTDANGCSSSATVSVTSFPLPTALFVGDILTGCEPLCVNFTDQSNGNGGVINQWNWVIQGQPAINTQNAAVCFANAGTYDAALTVTTSDGCTGTLTIANYITVYPNPIAAFIYAPQEIIETEPEVTFASTSSNAVSWLWSFGDGATDVVQNPLHAYGDTGTFCITLIVATNFGCVDTTIGCLNVKPDYNLFIPNTFTVNDDGLNEIWQVYGRGVKTIVVRIFDRWGEEIYTFDNINKGWPGTKQNGQECKQDVYVYRIEVMDGKGDPHTYYGNVNLIR